MRGAEALGSQQEIVAAGLLYRIPGIPIQREKQLGYHSG
jgi:hypothetical protein